jgi:PAS domain S-box-containing protein
MTKPSSRSAARHRRAALIGLLAGLLLALIVGGTARRIAFEREQDVAAETVKNDNLALAHKERSERALQVYDQALRFLRDDYLTHGAPANLRRRVDAAQLDLRHVNSLSFIGSDGAVLATTVDDATPNLADRDYFRFHAADASDRMRIGPPQLGRATGKWGITLTLRMSHADGRFAGVVYLSLAPSYFADIYAQTAAAPNGAMALIGLDGITRARRNGDKVYFGDDISASYLFTALKTASNGHYTAKAASDGVSRLVSYRLLQDYPMVVIVGSSQAQLAAAGVARERVLEGEASAAGLLVLVLAVGLEITLRRRDGARLALAAVENRFRLLFENSLDAVLSTTRTGQVLAANPAACAMFGMSQAQLQQVEPRRLVDWTDLRLRPLVAQRLRSGRVEGVLRLMRSGGEAFEAEVSSSTYLDDGGQAVASVVIRDISERGRLQAALTESAAELADLYDNAPFGYHSLDAEGRIVRINNTGLGWLGCEREAVVGRCRMTEFFTSEGRAQFARQFPDFLATGRTDGLEFDLVGRSGQTRRVSVSATSVRDAEGRHLMSRTAMFDISELHRVRGQMQELVKEQHAMLDTDALSMGRVRDRLVVWANRGMCRTFGYPEGALVGLATRQFYLDEASYAKLGEAAAATMAAGAEFRTQMQMRRADGEAIWIDARAVQLSPESGESLWLMADITPLKQAEAMRLHAADLESENRQLAETSRLKSLFLANMSHELRTPLNAVIGYSGLMSSGAVGPDHAKFGLYVQRIEASGKLLLAIIEEILDYAKAESDRLAFHPQAIALAPLVHEVASLQQLAADEKQLALRVQVDERIGPLHLDPLRLKQVLMNLLSNAIKFTPASGRVTMLVSAEGQDQLRIAVSDTGIGIAEADLPKLFNAFQQLSTGLSRQFGGTGLGLALTRRLVEGQGGSVGVTSVLGAGSTFHAVLPRVMPPVWSAESAALSASFQPHDVVVAAHLQPGQEAIAQQHHRHGHR